MKDQQEPAAPIVFAGMGAALGVNAGEGGERLAGTIVHWLSCLVELRF